MKPTIDAPINCFVVHLLLPGPFPRAHVHNCGASASLVYRLMRFLLFTGAQRFQVFLHIRVAAVNLRVGIVYLATMAPIPRPTGVGPGVAPPKPLARLCTLDHNTASLRVQRSVASELAQPISPVSRSSVVARAAPSASEAVSAIDAVVKQQAPHDSLLKQGTASAWEMLDKVRPSRPEYPPPAFVDRPCSSHLLHPHAAQTSLSCSKFHYACCLKLLQAGGVT